MSENPITEPTDDEVDAAESAAVLAALTAGHRQAVSAVNYWQEMAATLTRWRTSGGYRPVLPYSAEEWYETYQPALPFELDEMRAELHALSGLITKAHTIASIYAERAAMLGQEAAAVAAEQDAPDQPVTEPETALGLV